MKQYLQQQKVEHNRELKRQKQVNQQLQQINDSISRQPIRQQLYEQKQFNQYQNNRKQFIDYAITHNFYNTANDLLKNDQGQIIKDIINNKITVKQVNNIINIALQLKVIKSIQAEILTEKINNL